MTQKQMIELIQEQFPDRGETELRTMLNTANDQFVDETRIIQQWAELASIADQTDYGFSKFKAHGDSIPLLINVVKLADDPIPRLPRHTKKAWTTEHEVLKVGNYSTEDGNVVLTAVEAGTLIEVFGVFNDSGFGESLDTEPNYPKAFHEAIMARVLEKLHARGGTLEAARYWKNEYEETRVRAKRWVGSRGTKGNYTTEIFDFRGV